MKNSEYKFDEKNHVHTLDGKRLHGVTSVLKMWGDPNPLLNWGVKTAVDWIRDKSTVTEVHDPSDHPADKPVVVTEYKTNSLVLDDARTAHLKKRDKAGDIGTQVHKELEEMMLDATKGVLERTDPYTGVVGKVRDWMIDQDITTIEAEANLYSKDWWVGGIADGIVEKDGKKYILDFKTSGTVQTKYFFQLGAYAHMWEEMTGDKIDGGLIVHIPRGKSFNPEKNLYWRFDTDALKQAFKNILDVYKLDNDLKKLVTY